MTQKQAWFAVRLLFESTVEGRDEPDFEERIVLLRAPEDSHAEAKKRARKLASSAPEEYQNAEGKKVTCVLSEVLDDVQLLDEEIADGTEVYFRFLSAEGAEQLRASLASPLT